MKRKVKYRNYDRKLIVALFGNYSQNVPKPKRTLVESKFTQMRSKLTQAESKRTHDICLTSVCVQINRKLHIHHLDDF